MTQAHDATPERAREVVRFWQAAGPKTWFARDDAFDRHFRDTFEADHVAAAEARLADWARTAEGALALVILLDQFPRNAFRGTPRMFATDAQARRVADAAIAAGHDMMVVQALRLFFYLPFEHAEDLADQERAVALIGPLGAELLTYALLHRDVISRFGRFPHRNPILGRPMTQEEQRFLDEGGFQG